MPAATQNTHGSHASEGADKADFGNCNVESSKTDHNLEHTACWMPGIRFTEFGMLKVSEHIFLIFFIYRMPVYVL